MKLKNWKSEKNLKYEEKTQTQNVTTQIVTKLENLNYDNSILRFWENSETKIVTKPKIWQISIYEEKKL